MLTFQVDQDYDTISWNADKKLSWNDFKGKVPLNNRAAATTASGITYRYSTSGTRDHLKIDFKVDTYFYPNKSWYQPELCDAVILSHEQLHFDISELFARKMRKQLADATFTRHNIKADVKEIYRSTNEALAVFQNQYDTETNFSRDREEQQRWYKKITVLLNE